ncbi:MAG: signal peptide peptidase SppA [Coriobacteriaceae bacterium]|nr:signal peptide peptidase SppA [Coriobacteriaceae bacterium]
MSNQQNWQDPSAQSNAWQPGAPQVSQVPPASHIPPVSQATTPPIAPVMQPAYVSAYPPSQPAQTKGKGWIVGIVAILAILALLTVGMVSCASMFGSLGNAPTDEVALLNKDSIAIITISGTIQYDGSTASPEGLKTQLDRAAENDYIKAVVLRVNSGGGVATAGEEMALYVKDFPKPVVISSASINASAAYEFSSQADYIFTAKTTAIGSIGTAMSFTDLSGLYEKLGIHIEDITSAESKDSSYGNRPLTEEEREYYQAMIDEINESFIETVAEGRNMDIEAVRELATGLTFTGITGVENGLADRVGTLEDACDKAAELAGISDYETVYLRQRGLNLDMLTLLDLLSMTASERELLAHLREQQTYDTFTQ